MAKTAKINIKKVAFSFACEINPAVEYDYMGYPVKNPLAIETAKEAKAKMTAFVSPSSLAYKIITSNARTFSEKQLWVIAFEAIKNPAFINHVNEICA